MTRTEEKQFNQVMRHYDMAVEDLDIRKPDFDKADELFRSYLDEDTWPYDAMIFLPRIFTSLFEKTSRLIGGKPRGRLVPREKGDVIGAKINNALLDFQWDDAARVDGNPMVAKWAMMDQLARKYGASFALCLWHYEKHNDEVWFDGPSFKVLNNRDVLANPSYSCVKNWFQHREYLTLHELESVNAVARQRPIYKNINELRDKLKSELKTMDTREANYQSRNKTIKGYTDYLGRDEFNKIVEVVTEYSSDRWITFAPKHGIILRDIENPYKHGQIPVVMLKYYPIDDDLYGIPEWEPVEKTQKALNALMSQYIDAVNLELHSPIGIDSTRVRLHTVELGARKRWITTGDPRSAITKYDFGSPNAVGAFRTSYSILVGEIQEALGEASQLNSTVNPLESKKTATEIRDTAAQRLSRDNFNQIFLGEAIKQQMLFWYSMNQQFFFKAKEKQKILRIVGREYLDYFERQGLSQTQLSDEALSQLADMAEMGQQVNPSEYETPVWPVETPQGVVPKLDMQVPGEYGELMLERQDMEGTYDYIPDVSTMEPPDQQQELQAKMQALAMIKDPTTVQMLQQEGKTVKLSELIVDTLEDMGFKDAGKYVISLEEQNAENPQQALLNGTGAGGAPAGAPGIGNGQVQGMGAVQGNAGGQNPPFMGGSPPVQG